MGKRNATVLSFTLKQEEVKVRKGFAPSQKAHKNKKAYSRKKKVDIYDRFY